jgi:hypothetical protein
MNSMDAMQMNAHLAQITRPFTIMMANAPAHYTMLQARLEAAKASLKTEDRGNIRMIFGAFLQNQHSRRSSDTRQDTTQALVQRELHFNQEHLTEDSPFNDITYENESRHEMRDFQIHAPASSVMEINENANNILALHTNDAELRNTWNLTDSAVKMIHHASHASKKRKSEIESSPCRDSQTTKTLITKD